MRSITRWQLVLLFGFSLISAATASPPAESLLPATTKGFVSVPNVEALHGAWNRTQVGQLLQDPVMQPFVEDFRKQLQDQWAQSHAKLGLVWSDLEGVPSGEVALALIQPDVKEGALAIVVDVTGHDPEARQLLEKIDRNLAKQQAKKTQPEIAGVKVAAYEVPGRGDQPSTHAFYFHQDGLLIVSDQRAVLENILHRRDGSREGSLAGVEAYRWVQERCTKEAGGVTPHLRWFIEPFGYAEAARVIDPPREKRKGIDFLKVLKNQGFTAIKGLGGLVNFSTDRHEVLHRTAIFAPASGEGGEKYTLAARMLDLPNTNQHDPLPWLTREVAAHTSFNINVPKAFESSKSLVDDVVGEPVFEDVLESIKSDVNGPQLDIRTDLVGLLGTHVSVVSDYLLPITPKSERLLFAIETRDEARLTATLARAMQTDPDARRVDFGNHVIWEIISDEVAVPMVTIEQSGLGPGARAGDDEPEDRERRLPNSAMTVAHGHLLVCTHVDFLEKVLASAGTAERLDQAADYQIVKEELARLGDSQNCVRAFSRTDEEFRAVYELIRTGKMPQAETVLGKLLNAALGEGKEGILRKQKIEGEQLPPYETVRRYFGPAGLVMTSEEQGWFVTGFMLSKEPVKQVAAGGPAASASKIDLPVGEAPLTSTP